jgi:hypothetical protein
MMQVINAITPFHGAASPFPGPGVMPCAPVIFLEDDRLGPST